MNRTETQHREAAAAHYGNAAASFERSDTDGFVSQWASGIMGRLESAKADLAAREGLAEFAALFNLDGTIASTHLAHGQYGAYWVLNDEAAERAGRRFLTTSSARNDDTRRRNNRAKGFTEGIIAAPAYADTWAPEGARGLGGALSVTVVTKPTVAALLAGDYSIVTVEA